VVGETLNERYRIERRLGGGSQAEVFLATDSHMERQVAIKIWKPEGGFTVDEFLREAKLLARFGAPHFVTIHEHAATVDQRPFFVLEYLQGETLQDLSAPLTVSEIRHCVRDICVGLQKAHDEGIVHRDLKPSNIMLVGRGTRTERYVILDLGIAKITDATNWRRTLADATMAGAGTLLYMAPEQCNGNPIDQRTDIYAFGCLLFTLLVHEEPFAHRGTNYLSVLNAILNDPPRRLADVRPDGAFSEELEQLVQDCLAKKPEDRPASMTEVESRLEQCLPDDGLVPNGIDGAKPNEASGIRTRRPVTSATLPNRRPKRSAIIAGLVSVIVLAAGGLAFFLKHAQPEAKTLPEALTASAPSGDTKSIDKQAVDKPGVDKQAVDKHPVDKHTVDTPPANKPSINKPPVDKQPVPPRVAKPTPPPQLNDDRYVVVRNRTLRTDDPTGKNKDPNLYGVLANDGLPAGKPYEIERVEEPKAGKLVLNRDGTFTYASTARPGGDLARADSFKYRVRASDHDPWSEPAVVTIAIRPFADEEEAAIKRIAAGYGDAAIRSEANPPAVEIDFSESVVHKRVRDESLNILDGLIEVVREVRLDSQPITDSALEHLARFAELRVLSLAGTDISDAGLARVPSFKALSDIDLSDTLVTESAVTALTADRGQKGPLHIVRDGAIDRLRSAGVVIAAKNDATLGRNGFIATIPQADQFQKVVPLLKEVPRLVALVLSNSDLSDELLTENVVRQLKSLKALDLRKTVVSPQHVALLQKQFPGLQLKWDPPLTQLRLVGTVKEAGKATGKETGKEAGKETAANGVIIDLSGKKIDARTWILLSQVDNVTTLDLSGVAIDDLAFERLVQLTTLRELILQETGLAAQRILEICRRIPTLVSLDVQKSPIARDKIVLRALLAELRGHDRVKGLIRPEPVDEGPDLLTAPFDEGAAGRARALWAAYLNTPEQTANSIGMKLQLIPPGEFRMGSEETYLELVDRFPNVREAEEENPVSRLALESARPQHAVRITRPYYLAAYEVTNGQFKKFVEATRHKTDGEKDDKGGWGYPAKGPDALDYSGSEGRGFTWRHWGIELSDEAPVVSVSWNDAVAFCEWLSRKEGKLYRLPTEAEWEYACRAGTTTRYSNGDEPERLTQIGNIRDMTARQKFGWQNTLTSSDGSAYTNDVGRYAANHFGIYDMHGNAAEWCSDWFSMSYYREPPHADPTGPSTGALHVVRGGSWSSSAIYCRSAHRVAEISTYRSDRIGFRVVCVGTKAPWPPIPSAPPAQSSGVAPALLVAPFKEEQIGDARKTWSRYAQIDEQTTNLAGQTMLLVPPGEFKMGSTPEQIAQISRSDAKWKKETAKSEQPLHHVRISRPFYLAAHEVTRAQFARFVRATGYKTVCERAGGQGAGVDTSGKFKVDRKFNWRNVGFTQEDSHPVINVSWRDAMAFCTWLTWREGKVYRLPTEAEWEYACRAGTTTLFASGDDPESLATMANVADESAKAKFPSWRSIKGRDGYIFTAPVGSFRPNAFGLYDMHGNVREFCGDWHSDDYYAKSPESDPSGPSSGANRVNRGGAWTSNAADCRSASRGATKPTSAGLSLGFRVAADPSGKSDRAVRSDGQK
jgi:formylglycine-generating enzyme required for sulfatase activity/serine/threonine protein kinase